MNKRWFISYRVIMRNMLEEDAASRYCNVITNVSPAQWVLESQYTLGGERVILYAEEISQGLAVELSHGGGGVPISYFEERTDENL